MTTLHLIIPIFASLLVIMKFKKKKTSSRYEQKSESPEHKPTKSRKTESLAPDFANDTLSVSEALSQPPLVAGSLMAEPYLWRSLVTGQPLLRIHTTAIRSALLALPPGRHLLQLLVAAPVAAHLTVLSNTKFSLGDEEEILPKLTDESCRFVDQALHIMKCLADAVKVLISICFRVLIICVLDFCLLDFYFIALDYMRTRFLQI